MNTSTLFARGAPGGSEMSSETLNPKPQTPNPKVTGGEGTLFSYYLEVHWDASRKPLEATLEQP